MVLKKYIYSIQITERHTHKFDVLFGNIEKSLNKKSPCRVNSRQHKVSQHPATRPEPGFDSRCKKKRVQFLFQKNMDKILGPLAIVNLFMLYP
jgi:hypothetical protein